MDESQPLRIVVVGAGLGGLAAAVSFRRQGHRVEVIQADAPDNLKVFESSCMNKEIGAAITVQANAMQVLEYLGYEKDNLKGVDFFGARRKTVRFSAVGGEGATQLFHVPQDSVGRAGWLCHRTDLHDELKRLAIGEDGAGPPARLHLGQEVEICDPIAGTLTLKNGQVHQADLVVGADGIHSTIRTSVLGYVQKALPSGVSTFRCMFDATKLEGLSEMEWFSEGISGARVVLSPEARFRMLFLFPCRRGTLINVVAHHVDDRDQSKHVRRDRVEGHGHCERGGYLPKWDSALNKNPGRQGAGMAIEDAAVLGCLIPLGTIREDIPARLEAYQHLRRFRGDFVNRESLEQATEPSKRGAYSRCYDAVETAEQYYRQNFAKSK
ncbi:FAD/NAD(P)-binding domain-containing protein [Mycena vitilis]|nr:FAD/NAD(P)-binding domain-containing protein [Mycena vitilis]